MTNPTRDALKAQIVRRLDVVAMEHRQKHQGSKANRYKLLSLDGTTIEMMFEKNTGAPANLWVMEQHVGGLLDGSIKFERSPKDKLYTVPAKNGGIQYGRHSALEDMTLLGRADLIRFELESVEELNRILEVLSEVTRTVAVP